MWAWRFTCNLSGVLISSALPSTAAWFNEQVGESVTFATQILPDSTRHSLSPGTQPQPAEIEHSAPAHANRALEATSHPTEKKGASHVARRAEARSRSGRHTSRKDPGSATAAEAELQRPLPFLSVLGDILPQDGRTAAKNPGSGGNPERASSSKAPHVAGMEPANAAATDGTIYNVATGPAQTLTFANGSDTPAPATTAGTADKPSGQLDPAVVVTEQTASVNAQTVWQQEATGLGQVAFTARITDLAATQATQRLSGADAAIAAARFDTSNAGSHLVASDNTQPHEPAASNTNQPTDPAANSALEQATQAGTEGRSSANQSAPPPAGAGPSGHAQTVPGSGTPSAAASGQSQPVNPAVNSNTGQQSQPQADNQFSTKPSAQTASEGQNANRSSAQTASREISPVGAVTAASGARPDAAGSQNASAGMPATQTLSSGSEDSRNAAASKPGPNDRTPQSPEAQNEPNESTSGSVRDIAIQLSNKDQGTVQVRLSERAGELRVSVRTPDVGLSRGLRDGITDLVGRLEHNGYRAETWQPSDGNGSPAGDQGHDSPGQGGSSHGQDAGGSQSGAGHRRNARDQQHSDSQTPDWSGELQSSLKRSNNAWLPLAAR